MPIRTSPHDTAHTALLPCPGWAELFRLKWRANKPTKTMTDEIKKKKREEIPSAVVFRLVGVEGGVSVEYELLVVGVVHALRVGWA